jgi:hypothetical protein
MSEADRPELHVVANDETPALDEPAKSTAPRKGPKWENDARDRLKAAIRRFGKPLAEMASRDANEGDTRFLVTDFLCDGLGFDKYEDLTTEYQVRGEFADYGIRIDKDLVAFVEVKRIATKLGAKHLRQVQAYALNEGVEWVILTNGARWQAYHVTAAVPVEVDLALDVDLLGDESASQKVNQLFYLTRASLKRRQIDELWKARRAKSPSSLAETILSEAVVGAIRKELRRKTGHKADDQEVTKLLRETVLRPECFDK